MKNGCIFLARLTTASVYMAGQDMAWDTRDDGERDQARALLHSLGLGGQQACKRLLSLMRGFGWD